MAKMTKRFGAAGLLGVLAMTVSLGYCGGMEELRAGTAGFEAGMDIKEMISAQPLELAAPQPESRSEESARVVNDLLPAVKKGFFESEDRYLQRGKVAARAALSMLFSGAEGAEVGVRMHKCGMEWPGYDGLRAEAKWMHEGWKYSAEIYACHRNPDPFMLKYVAVTPADGDIGKMPKTNGEFIRLVYGLSRFRIETAEEDRDWKGRAGFRSALGGSAFVNISYTGIYSWFPEDVGAVFFQRLNDADLRYLKGGTLAGRE